MDSSCSGQPIHLWQFLKELLLKPHSYGRFIRWLNKEKGERGQGQGGKEDGGPRACQVLGTGGLGAGWGRGAAPTFALNATYIPSWTSPGSVCHLPPLARLCLLRVPSGTQCLGGHSRGLKTLRTRHSLYPQNFRAPLPRPVVSSEKHSARPIGHISFSTATI